jgi:hypothetical protein
MKAEIKNKEIERQKSTIGGVWMGRGILPKSPPGGSTPLQRHQHHYLQYLFIITTVISWQT